MSKNDRSPNFLNEILILYQTIVNIKPMVHYQQSFVRFLTPLPPPFYKNYPKINLTLQVVARIILVPKKNDKTLFDFI